MKTELKTGQAVSHLLFGGFGIVHSFVGKFDNVEYFNIGWFEYNSFPKGYNFENATPSNDLEILVTNQNYKRK